MDELGWDSCDIIIVTGDAYVDQPSFGMALIGRLLEDQGYRVGIIAQPDWKSKDAFAELGAPNLYFGVAVGLSCCWWSIRVFNARAKHRRSESPDESEKVAEPEPELTDNA